MKSIIQFSMKNGIALFLLIALVIGGGVYSLKQINIEKYPNVDIPYLTVVIVYPGASPDLAMKEIGEPLEKEMMNIDGVKNVYTDAVANAVYSTMEFDLSIDMDDAEQLVRSAIGKVNVPEAAHDPEYIKQGPDPDPTIYAVGIYSENLENVQPYVKETIVPELESVEGISSVETEGVLENHIFIQVIPDQLLKHGLTLEDIRQTITANNMSIPSGDVDISGTVLPVRLNNELTSIDDIKNIEIFSKNPELQGQNSGFLTVKLQEIATIAYESENKNQFTRINGKPAVKLGIVAEGGANIVAIVDEVKEKMKAFESQDEFQIDTLRDQSLEIKDSVYAMLREAVLGALMAVIVTLLFLRNLRSTIIAIISIPLSILASFTVLNMLGYTLNIMTLAGIAVAVGRVVDDSIVVIENVFRRVRTSKNRDAKLVEESTHQVATAITSSTITTVAVFLPMAFVPGIVGRFFAPLAWTVVISLLFSLIVAITVVPLMSKLFLLKISLKEHKISALQKMYRASLSWSLRHRLITVLAAVLLLASSVALIAPKLGTTFLPQDDVNNFDISISMEKGTAPSITSDVAGEVEQILLDRNDIDQVSTSVYGGSEFARISFVVSAEVEEVDSLIEGLREEFQDIKEAQEISVSGVGSFAGGAQSQYILVVNGSSLENIKEASNQIVDSLKEIDGMADVSSSLEGEEPEIELVLDKEKLADHGFMPIMVGKSLRDLISGDTVSTITTNGASTDIKLRLKMDEIKSLGDLGKQEIYNMFGQPVPLQELGELKEVKNRTVITHLNGSEYVMVFAQITDSKTGEITKQADDAIANLDLPEGVEYYKEGASAAMEEGFTNMAIAIAVSILLVYLVLVISFGEGKAPFVILFAIPFSVIGALLGLFVVGEPIGMPAMIGLLMLNGIVVTNAIVLLDRVKKNEKEGMEKHQALLEGGVVRLRPILMTAIATIGALFPMALSSHAGIVSTSLAVVVIGGLATSTLLTLFIVPVLYSLLHPTRKKTESKEIIVVETKAV